MFLHRIGLVNGLRRARQADISDAIVYMHQKHNHHIPSKDYDDFSCSSDGGSFFPAREVWDEQKLAEYVKGKKGRCVVVVKGSVVDVTNYLGEHVRPFSLPFREVLSDPMDIPNAHLACVIWRMTDIHFIIICSPAEQHSCGNTPTDRKIRSRR